MRNLTVILILLMLPLSLIGQKIVEYEYWFDKDYENKNSVSKTSNEINLYLDVFSFSEGLHSFNFVAKDENGYRSAPVSQYFLHIKPDIASNVFTQYEYWWDKDFDNRQVTTSSNNLIDLTLDVGTFLTGIHSFNFRTEDKKGTWSAPVSHYFYKPDIPKVNNKIIGYEYWWDDAYSDKIIVNIDPINPVEITDQLFEVNIPSRKVTPKDFKLVPDIYGEAKIFYSSNNTFNIRFQDEYGYWTATSVNTFGDGIGVDIVAEELQSNIPVIKDKPGNEEIHFYKLNALTDDSLIWKTDKPCTIQVFDPFGVEVYKATGNEVLSFEGTRAKRDGIYYVLLHSVNSSSKQITLDYTHIHKYAVLGYTPDKVGNLGSVWIHIHGNGFSNTTKVQLVNNDYILTSDSLLNKDLSNLHARFNIDKTEKRIYDLKINFEEEVIIIPNAIEIEEANAKGAIIEIFGNTTVLRGSTTYYTIKVKNPGNVTISSANVNVRVESNDGGMKVKSNTYSDFDKEVFSIMGFDIGDFTFTNTGDIYGNGDITYTGQFLLPDILPYQNQEFIVSIRSNQNFSLQAWEGSYTIDDLANFIESMYKRKEDVLRSNSESIKDICDKIYEDCYKNFMEEVNAILWEEGKKEIINQFIDFIPIKNVKKGVKRANHLGHFFQQSFDESIEDVKKSVALDVIKHDLTNKALKGNLVELIISGEVDKVSNEFVWDILDELSEKYPSSDPEILWDWAQHHSNEKAVKQLMEKSIERIAKGSEIAGYLLSYGGVWLLRHFEAKEFCGTNLLKDCNPPEDSPKIDAKTISSYDPNNKIGYRSPSGSTYFKEDVTNMTYVINFENDPEKATAAAQDVYITDTLDLSCFDINSFRAGYVMVGGKMKQPLYDVQDYTWDMDMRPGMNLITRVKLMLDKDKGIANWHLSSIDPVTDQPVTDIYAGFLPPNDESGKGQGSVSFSINLKENMPDKTEVSNTAHIVFDYNEAIVTPEWINKKDITAPISRMNQPVEVDDKIVKLSWTGKDDGSGIWRYTVYYQTGKNGQWEPLTFESDQTEHEFHYSPNIEYSFYVIATDSAMNIESKAANPEVSFFKNPNKPIEPVDPGKPENPIGTEDIDSLNKHIIIDGKIVIISNAEKATCFIYDMTGRIIYRKDNISIYEKISFLEKGVYIVSIRKDNKPFIQRKIFIQ